MIHNTVNSLYLRNTDNFLQMRVLFCTYVNTCKNNSISQTHFFCPLNSEISTLNVIRNYLNNANTYAYVYE